MNWLTGMNSFNVPPPPFHGDREFIELESLRPVLVWQYTRSRSMKRTQADMIRDAQKRVWIREWYSPPPTLLHKLFKVMWQSCRGSFT